MASASAKVDLPAVMTRCRGMPGNPRQIIAEDERQFPVRLAVKAPAGRARPTLSADVLNGSTRIASSADGRSSRRTPGIRLLSVALRAALICEL